MAVKRDFFDKGTEEERSVAATSNTLRRKFGKFYAAPYTRFVSDLLSHLTLCVVTSYYLLDELNGDHLGIMEWVEANKPPWAYVLRMPSSWNNFRIMLWILALLAACLHSLQDTHQIVLVLIFAACTAVPAQMARVHQQKRARVEVNM